MEWCRQEIERIYQGHVAAKTAISAHLPRLRKMAEGLDLVVEFGVKRGGSSSAFMLAAKEVISYDTAPTPEACSLATISNNWQYKIEDSRTAHIPEVDLLFIDSLHTYEQAKAELNAHGNASTKYLVFHDTTTFWEVGADGETGNKKWNYQRGKGSVPLNCLGIGQAVLEFMASNQQWRVHASYPESHGLLVLQKRW